MSSFVLLTVLGLAYTGTTTFTLPTKPPQGCATLDPDPVAMSFEFYKFPSYFTNVSNTQSCIKHPHGLSEVWPRIRIGGTSQNYSTYVPDLEAYIVYSVPDPATLAKNITFGPRFIDLVANYFGTVVLGLNRGGDNLNNTIEAAVAVEKGCTIFKPLSLAMNQSVLSPQPPGGLEQPPSIYNASNLIKYEDLLALKTIKTFSHYNYPQSTYFAGSLNLESLMKHQNIVENVGTFSEDVEAAKAIGWEYIFGETNSVSGGGSPLISPLFGSALWLVDHVLQAASINIKRTYLHQCTIGAFWYAFWDRQNVNSPFYDNGTTDYGGALGKASEGSFPTFGERWFESDCSIAGKEKVEVMKVINGKAVFEVAASEALIIDLC
ncbi:hypothetical protein BDZ45DRAFT_797229 [Acephala macrosclerotiorum]|nr:hypothetical protein BDZ45DRAFT_797229 [Acephala macrosclerotiorum]